MADEELDSIEALSSSGEDTPKTTKKNQKRKLDYSPPRPNKKKAGVKKLAWTSEEDELLREAFQNNDGKKLEENCFAPPQPDSHSMSSSMAKSPQSRSSQRCLVQFGG